MTSFSLPPKLRCTLESAGEIFGGIDGIPWSWERVVNSFDEFSRWVSKFHQELGSLRSCAGFGNHRKYESLGRVSRAARSYIKWVEGHGGHAVLLAPASGDGQTFEELYLSLGEVVSFGRTGRFDYLVLLARVGLLNDWPRRPYLRGATGPLKGARLLVAGDPCCDLRIDDLESVIIDLSVQLKVGCDVLEDAICNWQKSPLRLVRFRG